VTTAVSTAQPGQSPLLEGRCSEDVRFQNPSPLTYVRLVAAPQTRLMRKPRQTSLETVPTAPGALRRGRRSRLQVQSLRKPILLDFQSWMQLTQGAADAVEAAGKQGRLNFGESATI
jgi:hypothetical protein